MENFHKSYKENRYTLNYPVYLFVKITLNSYHVNSS